MKILKICVIGSLTISQVFILTMIKVNLYFLRPNSKKKKRKKNGQKTKHKMWR